MQKSFIGFLKCFWKQKLLLVITVVFFMLLAFGINFLINPMSTGINYSIDFKYTNCVIENLDEKITKDNLTKVKEIIIANRKQKEDGSYNYSDFSYVKTSSLAKNGITLQEKNDHYEICVAKTYFNSMAQARRFMFMLITNEEIIGHSDLALETIYEGEFSPYTFSSPSYVTTNEIKQNDGFLYLLYGALIGLALAVVFITIVFLTSSKEEKEIVYDNENVYRTPFHKKYWLDSLKHFKDTKSLVMMSILIALMQVCKLIPIPSGFGNLGISIGYIFFAIAGMLYGPLAGLLIGTISDTLGFFLFPTGYPFHFGYTLNAMISGFTYGICLYKTKFTFSKVLLARMIVGLYINVILGSIWWGQVADLNFSATITYMGFMSLPKNIVYLIPQSVILFMIIRALMPTFKMANVVDMDIAENISII